TSAPMRSGASPVREKGSGAPSRSTRPTSKTKGLAAVIMPPSYPRPRTLAAVVPAAVPAVILATVTAVVVARVTRRARALAQGRAVPADGAQRGRQRRLELGQLVVDVHVALAAEAVGIRVGGVDDAAGLVVGLPHHGGLG